MKECLNTFMAKHAALYSDSIQSTQLPYNPKIPAMLPAMKHRQIASM